MARPVTLFTGQWADLPLEDLAERAGRWGFDGLELACWGDHFEVDRALAEDDYCAGIQEVLERNHLNCFALGAHLVGQAVCDPIDARHQAILPPDVWGDGEPVKPVTVVTPSRAAARAVSLSLSAARWRTPSGSPSPHTSGGTTPWWRASMRSQTAWPTRWLPIVQTFRPWLSSSRRRSRQ